MRLWGQLLGLFVALPVVELVLLIEIGRRIGTWPTVLLVIATGAVGATLARGQGLGLLAKIKRELDRGEVPTSALADGLMVLIAGALLITPGVLTDAVGFGLLVPGIRSRIKSWLSQLVYRYLSGGRVVMIRRQR